MAPKRPASGAPGAADQAVKAPDSVVLTIGKFDGVHLGHRALALRARQIADGVGASSVALILHPHPATVLAGARIPVLSTPIERAEALLNLGLNRAEVLTFDRDIAAMEPHSFVRLLLERFPIRCMVVGPDFRFGRDRSGDAELLSRLGIEHGFDVEVFEPIEIDGEKVSSGRIRAAVREGDVESARRWLGRPPSIRGSVIRGAQRGRTIGFPTANLRLSADYEVPADGVYAVRCTLSTDSAAEGRGMRKAMAAANIGVRPTLDDGERSIEAFLLDFSGDLYGVNMEFEFIAFLRPEQRFENVDALVKALNQDVSRAREVLTDAAAKKATSDH